jgi:hypothetical protein
MRVILELSDLKHRVHETLFLCMQVKCRELISAALFGITFLVVHNFQFTGAVLLVIARCFTLVFH